LFTERSRSARVALIAGLAGGATLAGETLGARLLRPLVGSTAVAQAGVVAGILGGLGIGAIVASSRLTQTRGSPRRVLRRVLLALMGLTLAAPWLSRYLSSASARLLVGLASEHPRWADVVRTFVVLACTLPYGLLAGATYPCLASLHGRGAGRATAVTGAASSFGAALAVLGVTFVVAPAVGLRGGLFAAVALYVLALVVSTTFPRIDPIATDAPGGADEPGDANSSRGVRGVLVALVLAGVATSAWQLGMARLGVLAFGPSALALGATTAAYTLSFGTGEAAAVRWADIWRRPTLLLAGSLCAAAVCAIVSTRLAAHLPAWSARRFGCSAPTTSDLWMRAFAMLVALILPIAGLAAIALPLAARTLAESGATRASANARCLGAMAIGNVAGALGAPLVVLPHATLATVLLLSSVALAAAAVVVAANGLRGIPRFAIAVVSLAAPGIGGAWAVRGWDMALLASGPFLYSASDQGKLGRVVRTSYGREATVTVRRDAVGGVLLQIDGKIDAASGGATPTQTLVGVVPAVLCAQPRNVLVIGLGSGITVDAVRDVPGVVHVDVTEILPEVIDAARTLFSAANHDVLAASNVRVLRQDASLYLRGSLARYDVIVSQPSNPWVTGMADLFTVETFAAARDRLNPGGAMAVWFHTYSTDGATVASLLATFRVVFPRCVLVEMAAGEDYMVVGLADPVGIDVDTVTERLAASRLAAQLARAGISTRAQFFGRFLAGADGVRAMALGAAEFHADDLRLEFRAPTLLYNDASAQISALLARAGDSLFAGLAPRGTMLGTVAAESESLRFAARRVPRVAVARESRGCP